MFKNEFEFVFFPGHHFITGSRCRLGSEVTNVLVYILSQNYCFELSLITILYKWFSN